jgi:hypothetical protein
VYNLQRVTFYLSVDLFDRFLHATTEEITRAGFQLVGASCLCIAAKVEEVYPPKLKEFVYVTGIVFNF